MVFSEAVMGSAADVPRTVAVSPAAGSSWNVATPEKLNVWAEC
jgi:hypothetical protein